MACAQCGGAMEAESRFCPRCGAPVVLRANPSAGESVGGPVASSIGGSSGSASGTFGVPDPRFRQPLPPGYGAAPWRGWRVGRNLRTLGILWCCFGVYRLAAGFVGLIFFRTFVLSGRFGQNFPFGPGLHWPQTPWLASLVPVIVTGIVLSSSLAILTGIALLNRASWARVVAIIAGVLCLIKFPLGTALGMYTLYVLAPRASGAEWEELTARRV